MKIYLVGGAVRDKLLGLQPTDQDFLVTESSTDEMLSLGFIQVGVSFPIFLHPLTKEEYAFPRGETIEADLSRRDLSINSMAMDPVGKLIDPYNGLKDLHDKILRHVSDAFAEDPFRVYRVMRFKARYPGFTIAPETMAFMKSIISTSSFQNCGPARMIKELRVVLSLPKPSIFFEGLKEVGALSPFFSELEALIGVPQNPLYHPEGDAWVHTMLVLDHAAKLTSDILVRYSALVHDLGKGVTPKEILPKHIGHEDTGVELVKNLGARILAPNDWTEAAVTVTRFHLRVYRIFEMKPSSIIRMFYEMDAFRKPHLVKILAIACEADEMGKMKGENLSSKHLLESFNIVKDVSFKDINPELTGKAVGEAIREERIKILRKAQS